MECGETDVTPDLGADMGGALAGIAPFAFALQLHAVLLLAVAVELRQQLQQLAVQRHLLGLSQRCKSGRKTHKGRNETETHTQCFSEK